jgi:hypothetical protein
LDWRLDVQVEFVVLFYFLLQRNSHHQHSIVSFQIASRSVRSQFDPVFMLKLETAEAGSKCDLRLLSIDR